jgi:cellulose synthase/poly-beta-1,6-N-acetylglucosamine synthase-like glycosyltransferase
MGMLGGIAGGAGGALLLCGAVLIALAMHPFTTYPLSLRWLVRWRPRPVRMGAPMSQSPVSRSRVALCVCAYNEERVIQAKVENMLTMRQAVPGLEILVYVDAASDATAEILRGYGDALRLVVSPERHGKTYGMNTLIGLTDAELVVFSDANVMFAADAIPRLLAPFADAEVGVVCGHLLYTGPGGNATARSGSLYWRLEEHIKALESASGSVMGADGSIFAIRRALHEPPPPDLIDDMFVSLAVLCGGMRIVRAADALAFEDAVSRPGEEFRRKIRIACQAFNVHRALWSRLRGLPFVDRYKYISHKLLRWQTIYLLGLGVASLLAGLALIGAPILAACLVLAVLGLLAVLWRAQHGVLATLWDVLRAFFATGVGVWRSLRGDRFQTWSPPISARTGQPASASSHDASRLNQQTAAE